MSYIKRYLELCEDYGKETVDAVYAEASGPTAQIRYEQVKLILENGDPHVDRRFDQPQTI